MGQATVALPDPLSAAPVSPGNTDDLLAQLAGEEIERLLAEADEPEAVKGVEPSLGGNAAPAPRTGFPSVASPAPVSSLLEVPDTSRPQTSPPAAPLAGEKEDLELNALFTQLDGAGPLGASAPPAPAAAIVAAPVSVPDAEPSAADALAEEMLEDAAVSGRSALASDVAPVAARAVDENRAPAVLPIRLLEWVNRPLDSCSDQCRELIGKIAILTTVNAAAVLAYVIFFRGR